MAARLDREAVDRGLSSTFLGAEPEEDLPTLGQPALDACADELGTTGG